MQTFTVSWLTDVLFAAIYATQSAGYAHLTPSATNDQGSQNSGPSGADGASISGDLQRMG
jgi:hypothetical protein